jgi:hypothetical protein
LTQSQVTFLKGQPATCASSAEARRGFCARGGTQICFTATVLPGLIDLTTGSFDVPQTLRRRCTSGIRSGCRGCWLPRYPEFPPQ